MSAVTLIIVSEIVAIIAGICGGILVAMFMCERDTMTVKELIEALQQENQDADVYIMNDSDIAFKVTAVSRNVLTGTGETVTIH